MAASIQNPILVIVKNVGALTAANLLGRLLNMVIIAVVARTSGADGLGGYATANAVASFVLIFADLGLAARLTREASTNPSCTALVYVRSMSVKIVTSMLVCVALGALFFVVPYEPWVRDLLILLSISWLIRSYTAINHAVIRAREHMELEAASVLVQTVVFIGGALACLYLGLSLVTIGWAAIAAALVQLAVTVVITRRYTPIKVVERPHWQTLREAAPYATALLAHIAFAQSNVVILSLIASQALVGEFTSVSRILVLASIFPQLVNLAMMPAASRVFGQDDPARFRRLTTASLRMLLILGGVGAVALVTVSQLLMGWIYGEELEALYPLLQLGALYFVLQFTSGTLGIALTSSGRQGARARAVMLALTIGVVLVLILTPLLGILGAVLALVLSELALVLIEMVTAWDLVDSGDLIHNAAWVGGAAALAVAVHFALADTAWPWLSVIVSPLLYAALLLPSGEFGKLLELMRSRR